MFILTRNKELFKTKVISEIDHIVKNEEIYCPHRQEICTAHKQTTYQEVRDVKLEPKTKTHCVCQNHSTVERR